jgi:SecY interacting protein Syd
MSQQVSKALDEFIVNYSLCAQAHPHMRQVDYDPDWPSQCYLSTAEAGQCVDWQPVKRDTPTNFNGIEQALNLTIHPDLVCFYTQYWSGNLNAKSSQGALQLLQAWDLADFERLQQNLVGHILMKRRLKQPETLFFALTDQDDFILCVDNNSGEVVLEQVGLLPQETIAANLASFIRSLEPDVTVF